MPERICRVATRASALALAQTEVVVERLRTLFPRKRFEVVTIKTTGDAATAGGREPLGKGIFVKEIEEALLAGEADMAVHSLKDLPTELPPGLTIAAIPERADPRDALISKTGAQLDELPAGAVIGTGSNRRAAQLLACRPDLRVEPIRGNLDTRLTKLEGTREPGVAYDAIIVAVAGCRRLRLENRITEIISPHTMLPAPGQGALAIEVRNDSAGILDIARALDDEAARRTTTAERAFLRALGGGCRTPIGALAEIAHDSLTLRGRICASDGRRFITGTNEGPQENAEHVGTALAETLLDSGGRLLLDRMPTV
ncbi:MAG: hydroxymethylbilane synthase [Verrucomicrobia bacterium]|nr:hydroxymethylbilane synthase [Verrucomicrobiota bacterium]